MRTATIETREDKIRHIGQETVNGVPIGGTATAALMALSPSPAEERPTKKRPAQHIGCGSTPTETMSQLAYQARDCSGGLWQWRQLAAAMYRGKRRELARRESNKNDQTKLIPLPVDPHELYCTPVMFARFVCALLSLHSSFLRNPKPENLGKLS